MLKEFLRRSGAESVVCSMPGGYVRATLYNKGEARYCVQITGEDMVEQCHILRFLKQVQILIVENK